MLCKLTLMLKHTANKETCIINTERATIHWQTESTCHCSCFYSDSSWLHWQFRPGISFIFKWWWCTSVGWMLNNRFSRDEFGVIIFKFTCHMGSCISSSRVDLVYTAFLCVQRIVWLSMLGTFNVQIDITAYNCIGGQRKSFFTFTYFNFLLYCLKGISPMGNLGCLPHESQMWQSCATQPIQSALKVDPGTKIPCPTRKMNLHQQHVRPKAPPAQLHPPPQR